MKYPFLISVPHGGVEVPDEVAACLALSQEDLLWYCDPLTREIFDFGGFVEAHIDTPVSRMVIDLNRPPLPLPLKDPDGVIKVRTIDGRQVYLPGQLPDLPRVHRWMMQWYFPYHQRIDELIDSHPVRICFDCHSMLPFGSKEQADAGRTRPLICLGNYGDKDGRARPGNITTCPPGWIRLLAGEFEEVFPDPGSVAINTPFSGGFISNAHYWRKGIPWIQIEVNRQLYEQCSRDGVSSPASCSTATGLRDTLKGILARFWDNLVREDPDNAAASGPGA